MICACLVRARMADGFRGLGRHLRLPRDRLGNPPFAGSAYRSAEQNRAVGRAQAAKDTRGTTFDIAMANHDPAAFEAAAPAASISALRTMAGAASLVLAKAASPVVKSGTIRRRGAFRSSGESGTSRLHSLPRSASAQFTRLWNTRDPRRGLVRT